MTGVPAPRGSWMAELAEVQVGADGSGPVVTWTDPATGAPARYEARVSPAAGHGPAALAARLVEDALSLRARAAALLALADEVTASAAHLQVDTDAAA